MDNSSRIAIEPGENPGELRRIRHLDHPELTRVALSPNEWEKRTGMGNHVSFGAPVPVTQPGPAPETGTTVPCPACKGEGVLGWVGTASTCVFCLGATQVAQAEAARYRPNDPLQGAEPTLRRIEILIYQMNAFDRSRELLEEYGFTHERLEAELDEEELDRLWGYDGRQLAGRDFRGEDLTGSDFSGAILTGANFAEADLEDATFDGANLTEADFTGADLTRVAFTGAKVLRATFERADVTGADCRGATGLDASTVEDLGARGALADDPAG